ncbi:MAG TPA: PEP-CTERM sorting domain-containing protein [Pirellulales bacterium]|jgi:hypothetical protein|nr:PEP-CTERM sorting domain-containing protein [Pirellulales bacterium]
MRFVFASILILVTSPLFGQSGPFAAQVEPSGSSPGYTIPSGSDAAVPWNSPNILEWASAVVGTPSYGTGSYALKSSPSDNNPSVALSSTTAAPIGAIPSMSGGSPALTVGGLNVVSLGEDGSITVSFPSPIADGPGNDFAVFSNGFLSPSWPDAYSKVATVSVSSNGVNFYSFPTTFGQSQLGGETFGTTTYYESFDASNLYNLAGKYATGFGTPFDLGELIVLYPTAIEDGLLELNDITQVKMADAWDTLDSNGNEILDAPGATSTQGTFSGSSAGFNFAGIAVLNDVQPVPEPSTLVLALAAIAIIIWIRRGKIAACS